MTKTISFAGYEGPIVDGRVMGPVCCSNCRHYDWDSVSCAQQDMVSNSERDRLNDGRVIVHPEGWCHNIERVGRLEPDDD